MEGGIFILKIFKVYKDLPRSIYILFIAQIVNRFGDFVVPFLTLYLTQKIGLSAGVSGVIVTASILVGIPASLIGGKTADSIGRRKTYLWSQSIAAISLIPCAIFTNPIIIVICLMINAFFCGFIRPALGAIVADILPPNQRQLGFSLQYLGTNIGVAVGPIVAGILFKNMLPMLFIGDAVTSLIAVILIALNVQETNPSHNKAVKQIEKEKKSGVIRAFAKRPYLCVFLIVYIAYTFVYTQHRFSLPITMGNIYKLDGSTRFGYLMSINAVTVIFLTMTVTSLTQKLHAITKIIIAGILYAVGFGMIGIIQGFALFVLSTIIWTVGEILVTTAYGVYIANNSPSNYRASFSAIGGLSWSIGGALGTSLAGKFIDIFGINYIWSLTFIISVAATIGMYIVKVLSVIEENRLKEHKCEEVRV
jgi:MFS family permease